jgi:uncharacterized RDD family membrane protein YckC
LQTAQTFQQPVAVQKESPQPEEETHAGFWLRVGAYIIDFIIIMIIAFVIGVGLGILFYTNSPGYNANVFSSPGFLAMFYVIFIPIIILYFALQESSSKQATLGKRAVHVKVISLEGNRISFGKAAIRTIVRFIPVVGPLGCLAIGFSAKKQGLHDWAASTYVVFSDR